MKIAICASEASPYAKSGGLGDVMEALPRALAKLPGALEHPFYGEWVRGYASDDYAVTNQALIDLMDELAEGITEAQFDRLAEIFVNCSRYELGFWDMAWEMRP